MARIRFDQDGSVGILTITNPPHNLFDRALFDETAALMTTVEAADIRALLLRAEGEIFSGGADVKMFQGMSPAEARNLLSLALRVIARIEHLPYPTLAVTQGMCLAGGLEVALACDFIWAGESTKFGLVEAVIGVVPFGGGTQRLAERAGPARAREIVMRAAIYDAATFERWNIINRVVPDADLQAKGMKFARELAAGPTVAHGISKRLVREYLDHGIRGADRLIPELAPALFATEDIRHGIESLLANGPGQATFHGR